MGGASVKASMGAVPVVVMQPARQLGIAHIGVGISLGVSPLA